MQNTPASRTRGCVRILTRNKSPRRRQVATAVRPSDVDKIPHGGARGSGHRMVFTDMNANANTTRYFALIPCAGNGSRAGTAGPKQYERVAGQPMVWHTLSAFAGVKRIARTLVVVAPGDGFFERNPSTSALVVPVGGETRAASVTNGLRELRRVGAVDNDWVLVHDAARCPITPALIDRLIDACANDEVGGLLAHPLPDTLKVEKDGRAVETLER